MLQTVTLAAEVRLALANSRCSERATSKRHSQSVQLIQLPGRTSELCPHLLLWPASARPPPLPSPANAFIHPPIMRPISSFNLDHCSYFLKSIYPIFFAIRTCERSRSSSASKSCSVVFLWYRLLQTTINRSKDHIVARTSAPRTCRSIFGNCLTAVWPYSIIASHFCRISRSFCTGLVTPYIPAIFWCLSSRGGLPPAPNRWHAPGVREQKRGESRHP